MSEQKNNDYKICSGKYKESLWSILSFEIRSFIGRNFQNKKPPIQNGKQLLNLGCGTTIINRFVNSDFYNGLLSWNYGKNVNIWTQDFRYCLNCPNNYWDGVFTEHTLEHLYPIEVLNLLKEIHRTLKKGKWLRVSVPDLEEYVKFYNYQKNREFKKYWKLGAEAIWSLTQNWGHRSVWDYDLLKLFLEKSGFKNIRRVSYKVGTDKYIIKDGKNRKSGSLYIEAQK
jgi:predicted SAM-dependent methyltransferase